MYIVIVGAGKVGHFLARKLTEDKHTVALIDKDKSVCSQMAKELEVLLVHGDGCDLDILKQAGIERANVLAAVTGEDEDNVIICQLAKEQFNISRTVGRINDPNNEHLFSVLGVDVPIDATGILAKIIEEEVSFSDLVNLMSFKRGKLAILRIDLPGDSPVINKQIQDITLPRDCVLVSILRGEEVIIPKGDTVLQAKDDIIALTLIENEKQLLDMFINK